MTSADTATAVSTNGAAGLLLGAACGDALGWPQEDRGGLVGGRKARLARTPESRFTPWLRTGGRYARYQDPVDAGEYSDDTQLLLAVARCCADGGSWFERLVSVELPTWPLYQRGGGGASLRAASAWAAGSPPWAAGSRTKQAAAAKYFDAGGNGVAMRIAPHVLVASDRENLTARVVRDGAATHGHPRALVGAVAYAHALDHALRAGSVAYGDLVHASRDALTSSEAALHVLADLWGPDVDLQRYSSGWATAVDEMRTLLSLAESSLTRGAMSSPETTFADLGCVGGKATGAGTVTAAGAVYAASRFAARPLPGLVSAAFLHGADTDTLASMAGALFGALHGPGFLGVLGDTVQDAELLVTTSLDLAAGSAREPERPASRPSKLVRQLSSSEALRQAVVFPDGRRIVHRRHRMLDGREPTRRWLLRLEDGQTVVVDVKDDRGPDYYSGRSAAGPSRPAQLPLDEADPNDGASDAAGSNTSLSGATDNGRSDGSVSSRSQAPVPESAVPETGPDDQADAGEAKRPVPPGHAVEPFVSLARQVESQVVQICLSTGRFNACASFYSRLLGRAFTVQDRHVQITPWLVLRESHKAAAVDAPVSLVIAVPEVSAVHAAVGGDLIDEVLKIIDPDGREVTVVKSRS